MFWSDLLWTLGTLILPTDAEFAIGSPHWMLRSATAPCFRISAAGHAAVSLLAYKLGDALCLSFRMRTNVHEQVIKGVPVERWSRQQSVFAYWIIGTFFGKAVSNNKKVCTLRVNVDLCCTDQGCACAYMLEVLSCLQQAVCVRFNYLLLNYLLQGHLVGHIKDIGHDPTKPTTRLYATHEAQPFHNDSSDIVGCAKSSHVCSPSVAGVANCSTSAAGPAAWWCTPHMTVLI